MSALLWPSLLVATLIVISTRINFVIVLQLQCQWQCCSHCLLPSLPYAACSITELSSCQTAVPLAIVIASWLPFLVLHFHCSHHCFYATVCTLLLPLFLPAVSWSCQSHCCCCNYCWLIATSFQMYSIVAVLDAVMPLLPVANLPLPAAMFLIFCLLLLPKMPLPVVDSCITSGLV